MVRITCTMSSDAGKNSSHMKWGALTDSFKSLSCRGMFPVPQLCVQSHVSMILETHPGFSPYLKSVPGTACRCFLIISLLFLLPHMCRTCGYKAEQEFLAPLHQLLKTTDKGKECEKVKRPQADTSCCWRRFHYDWIHQESSVVQCLCLICHFTA